MDQPRSSGWAQHLSYAESTTRTCDPRLLKNWFDGTSTAGSANMILRQVERMHQLLVGIHTLAKKLSRFCLRSEAMPPRAISGTFAQELAPDDLAAACLFGKCRSLGRKLISDHIYWTLWELRGFRDIPSNDFSC